MQLPYDKMYAAGGQHINQACEWKAGQKRRYRKYDFFFEIHSGIYTRSSIAMEKKNAWKKSNVFSLDV